jgi:hypothetical protein
MRTITKFAAASLLSSAPLAAAAESPSYLSLDLAMPATELALETAEADLRLSPDSPRSAGFTLSAFGVAVSAGYAFPQINQDAMQTTSRADDYRFSKTAGAVGFELGYGRYKGFNVTEAQYDGEPMAGAEFGDERKDLQIESANVDLHWLWHSTGMKLSDILSMEPVKGKGQGGFLTVSHDHARLGDEGGIVPEPAGFAFKEAAPLAAVDVEAGSASLGWGVSHNWDGLYLSAAGAYGLGRYQATLTDADGTLRRAQGVYRRESVRSAIGFAGKRVFTGFLGTIEQPKYDLGEVEMRTERLNFCVNMGARF